MHEIDVALSDYAISFFTTFFAVSLLRSPAGNAGARQWLVILFLSLSAGALLGGTYHGFFPDNESWGHDILWPATMIAMGVTAHPLPPCTARRTMADLPGWALGGSNTEKMMSANGLDCVKKQGVPIASSARVRISVPITPPPSSTYPRHVRNVPPPGSGWDRFRSSMGRATGKTLLRLGVTEA